LESTFTIALEFGTILERDDMRVEKGRYTAICSDSCNSFSWLILVFRDNDCIGYKELIHKPNENDLIALIERYKTK